MNDLTADSKPPKRQFQNNISNDIDDEIAFHLALAAEEACKLRGMKPDEAKSWAVEQFGSVDRIRAMCLRVMWKERMMEKLFSPVVTVVLFLLVIGIGLAFMYQAHARHQMAIEARLMAMEAERHARAAQQEAEQAMQRSTALNQMLTQLFANVEPSETDQTSLESLLNVASQHVEDAFKDDPETIEKLRQAIAKAQKEIDAARKKETSIDRDPKS